MSDHRAQVRIERIGESSDGDPFRTIRTLRGHAGLDGLDSYVVELVAYGNDFDPGVWLQSEVNLLIGQADGSERQLRLQTTGIRVREQAALGPNTSVARWELTLLPPVWRLSQSRRRRAWRDMSTAELATVIFREHGLEPDRDIHLTIAGPDPARSWNCQYEESDLDFLRRQFERQGLCLVAGVEEEGRLLHVGDSFPSDEPIELGSVSPRGDSPGIASLFSNQQHLPERIHLRGFENHDPRNEALETTVDVDTEGGTGTWSEYAGVVGTREYLEHLARVRAEHLLSHRQRFLGEARGIWLRAGDLIEVSGTFGGAYRVIRAEYDFSSEVENTDTRRMGMIRFEAVPAEAAFRPEPVTRRPEFHGLLDATLAVGAVEEELELPEVSGDGRYRVVMPFPARNAHEEEDWPLLVRIGENAISHLPMRGNDQVLLSFVEGDPDRPVISETVGDAQGCGSEQGSCWRTHGGNGIDLDEQGRYILATSGDGHAFWEMAPADNGNAGYGFSIAIDGTYRAEFGGLSWNTVGKQVWAGDYEVHYRKPTTETAALVDSGATEIPIVEPNEFSVMGAVTTTNAAGFEELLYYTGREDFEDGTGKLTGVNGWRTGNARGALEAGTTLSSVREFDQHKMYEFRLKTRDGGNSCTDECNGPVSLLDEQNGRKLFSRTIGDAYTFLLGDSFTFHGVRNNGYLGVNRYFEFGPTWNVADIRAEKELECGPIFGAPPIDEMIGQIDSGPDDAGDGVSWSELIDPENGRSWVRGSRGDVVSMRQGITFNLGRDHEIFLRPFVYKETHATSDPSSVGLWGKTAGYFPDILDHTSEQRTFRFTAQDGVDHREAGLDTEPDGLVIDRTHADEYRYVRGNALELIEGIRITHQHGSTTSFTHDLKSRTVTHGGGHKLVDRTEDPADRGRVSESRFHPDFGSLIAREESLDNGMMRTLFEVTPTQSTRIQPALRNEIDITTARTRVQMAKGAVVDVDMATTRSEIRETGTKFSAAGLQAIRKTCTQIQGQLAHIRSCMTEIDNVTTSVGKKDVNVDGNGVDLNGTAGPSVDNSAIKLQN